MTENENRNSNPAAPSENQAEDAVFGSEEDFFGALENNVNSAIQDETVTDETQEHQSGPIQETRKQNANGPEGSIDWEKRYKDSTREAQKMNQELSKLKPFVPVLNAMKNDTGLVQHVRDYLRDGGTAPKNIKEKLGLGEDFEFNPHELDDPTSDSSKVMNAQVDSLVQGRLQQVIAKERQNFQTVQKKNTQKTKESEFKARHKMNDKDFNAMMQVANKRELTLDDIYHLVNKDQSNKNVANSTKNDMLTQMKNVRNIPTSASGVNSASEDQDFEKSVFDLINGSDGDVDNLFG